MTQKELNELLRGFFKRQLAVAGIKPTPMLINHLSGNLTMALEGWLLQRQCQIKSIKP